MTNKTYQLETLTCPGCTMKIEGALKRIEGLVTIEVLFNSSRVKVSYDERLEDPNKIKEVIENLGFKVLSEK